MTQEKPQNDEYWLTPKEYNNKTHRWRTISTKENKRRELMRDFFGEEFAANEIAARLAPGNNLGDLLPNIIQKIKKDNTTPLHELQEIWQDFVGEKLATMTKPTRFEYNCLTIEVSNSSLLYILKQEYAGNILGKLQNFDRIKIKRLDFINTGFKK